MGVALLSVLSLLAFAGNSLLARQALAGSAIDPASFTTLRLLSGALVLWILVARDTRIRDASGCTRSPLKAGDWPSGVALFAYAALFSFAYRGLTAATGALLLFGAVQVTMLGSGLWRGERFGALQWAGLALALTGLLVLLRPGLDAPALASALPMAAAGVAWGVYSLRGARAARPLQATAGNFKRAVPLAAMMSLALAGDARLDMAGAACALASGAVTSALGYAAWYAVLPRLPAMRASVLQLAVPVVTALGAVLLLGEAVHLRLLLCSAAILGGVLVVVTARVSPANA